MQVVKACSVTAERGAAFDRPHYRSRVTEVYSAVAGAARAQRTSAALIGGDGTALFHHAAYAARYAADSVCTPNPTLLATGGALTRQGKAMPVGRSTPVRAPTQTRQGNPRIRSSTGVAS